MTVPITLLDCPHCGHSQTVPVIVAGRLGMCQRCFQVGGMSRAEQASRALILTDLCYDAIGFESWAALNSIIQEFRMTHCDVDIFTETYSRTVKSAIAIREGIGGRTMAMPLL